MQKAGAKSKGKAPQIRAKSRPALRSVVSHKAAIQKAFHPFLMPLHGSKRERGGDKSPRGLGPASPLRQPSVRQNAPLRVAGGRTNPGSPPKSASLQTRSLTLFHRKKRAVKEPGDPASLPLSGGKPGLVLPPKRSAKCADLAPKRTVGAHELRSGDLHSCLELGSALGRGYPIPELMSRLGA